MKTLFKKSIALLSIFVMFSCSKDSPTSTPITPTCPQGYSGVNCSTQITPTKISISKIQIVKYPTSDPNSVTGLWDSYSITNPNSSNPDIAIVLTDVTSGIVLDNESNNYFADATPNFTYSYTYNPFLITNPLNLFKIDLRDIDDNNTYELMDSYYFTIYSTTNNFPNVITIDTGISKYNLYVSYSW